MEKITVNGEFIFELSSKQDWINNVKKKMPKKIRGGEQWIWVDINGNVFECGLDFRVAQEKATYPCKVYRLQNVGSFLQ